MKDNLKQFLNNITARKKFLPQLLPANSNIW